LREGGERAREGERKRKRKEKEKKKKRQLPTVHPAKAAGWGGDAQPTRVAHSQKETRDKIQRAVPPA
jgi:hypothetical protein